MKSFILFLFLVWSIFFDSSCLAQIKNTIFQDQNREYFYINSTQEMKDRNTFFSVSSSADTIDFNRISFIAIISSSGPTSICPGQSVVLTGNGGSGYTYLWTTGQTTKSITVNQPGVYGLTIFCSKCNNATYVANPITINTNTLVTDLNTNGIVDVADYNIFLGKYLTPCLGCQEDFYPDGFVDTRDYLIWVADIFKTCN